MKRWRQEDPSGDPAEQRARAWLEAVEPLPDSSERMRRVRQRLSEQHARGGRLAALRRVPALVLVACGLLFGASAFAAVRVIIEQARGDAPGDVPGDVPGDAPAASEARPTRAAPSAPSTEASIEEALDAMQIAEPQAATVMTEQADVGAPRAAPPSKSARARDTARADADAADSALVHRAVQALRRDGDPALAARLLEQHEAKVPKGPLAEETLALRIEAALALRDTRARAFAERYLARYPTGRYLHIARRALGNDGTEGAEGTGAPGSGRAP